MTLCLGAILGPAIGGVLYHITPVAFFAVPAVFFVAYLTLVLVRGRMLSALERDGVCTPSTRQTLGKPLRDRRLLAVVGAGIVIFFVFSQLESMIPLYLKSHYGDRTEAYYSAAFIMCAVLALALQVPLYRVITKLRHNHVVVLGAMMFAVSFLCFWASSGNLALLYVGIVFWTVGEGVLLPMPDMAVHELADNTHKGAYFGLSEIRYLGFFAGPFAGGFLLAGSEALYFAAMGAFIFLCVPPLLRRSSDREPLPEASPEPSHTS
jgi:MFS family permease